MDVQKCFNPKRTAIIWFYRIKNYLAAVREYPRGVLCGFCGSPNFFFDDCGWFCISPFGKASRANTITCERCYRGPLGQAHVARYGLGER